MKLQILELGYSHVFISWEYERNDYYQVTSSFQVRLKKANGNIFVATEVLKPDKRFYNTTGLEPNTKYELSVSAVTPYGTRNTPAQVITTAGKAFKHSTMSKTHKDDECGLQIVKYRSSYS